MAYNILVVDDSKTVRRMITKTLGMAGIPLNELYQAENGREGLEVLAANWIDLVLTDINMPEMDGVEMIEHMSDDGMLKTVPVVVVSTEGSETRIEELKQKGIRGYVRKPFTPEAIKDVVEEILGGQDDG
jgi:two-component system, chemotaxis family, chemotaxis protein CheY